MVSMGIKFVPRIRGRARTYGFAKARLCALLALVALLFSGCATTKDRGDRAFEADKYSEALDYYEVAIDDGSRDADLYFNAAEAALRIGDFSLAERYYSRALRYGGGTKVKRAMAEFYIATSNYTKAVRVLQELLETTDDPQSVFNNLGAALMYGGLPLEAEAYLLVAQQMKPSDPVPYVNLGVLYDKHMRQPRLALGFYRCYLKQSNAPGQRRKIAGRVKALEMQYDNQDDSARFNVQCGQPYQPPKPPSKEEVRQRLSESELAQAPDDAEGGDDEAPGDKKGDDEKPADDQTAEDDTPPPVIYRQVEDVPEDKPSQASQSEQVKGQDAGDSVEALRLAEEAFAQDNHKDVVRHLETLPASSLDAHSMALYGRSLAALGQHKQAQRWLAGAVAEDATEQSVAALYAVYLELGENQKIHQLCERFEDDQAFDDVLENCPKKQLIEHLKKEAR
jgi:tetratricopeptide (TPR) repeat protein